MNSSLNIEMKYSVSHSMWSLWNQAFLITITFYLKKTSNKHNHRYIKGFHSTIMSRRNKLQPFVTKIITVQIRNLLGHYRKYLTKQKCQNMALKIDR